MRYISFLIFLLVSVLRMDAQTPRSILDAVAAEYSKKGDTEIAFVMNNTNSGVIRLSGQKFNIETEGVNMWFNGKTLWAYVKENGEVNVTNPTQNDIAKINPYAFVSMYKDGYSAAFGQTSASTYHIVLNATDAKKTFQQIDVYVDKANKRLESVKLTTRRTSMSIDVKSYKYKKFADAMFVFDKKQYPRVDVIDLR